MMIRKMNMEDYDGAYALWMSCAGMGLNSIDDSRDGIRRFLQRNPDTCFVAEEDNALVGVILAGNDGRRGYIYHAAVSPRHRKRGIGRQLVEAVLQGMERAETSKIALVVFERNENGNLFWEKLGFTVREDLVYRNRAIAELVRIDT